MATDYTKKDILLGQTIDEVVTRTDENIGTLFDYIDDVNDTLSNTKLDVKPDGSTPLIDSDNKINTNYLPDTVLGQVEFRGTFSASTGANQVNGELAKGWYFICISSGNYNPDGSEYIYNDRDEDADFQPGGYEVGDWAIYNDGIWDKVDNTDAVTLVNGQKGSVETYKGVYNSTIKYNKGDQVLYEPDGCLYLCIATPSSANIIPTNTAYWKIFGKVYSNATTSDAGLMSAEDKTKLNSVSTSSHSHNNKAVLDATTASYTTEEKNKLAGIEDGANKTTVDSTLSTTSTNPVQNKKVKEALDAKVDKVTGKGLSSNDYTSTEKTKLANIAEGANKTVVDNQLSDSSTNPVQNAVITDALSTKVTKVTGKGLSTNDYTTAEKEKLAQIDSSLLGVTADDIGKVKDVTYNGSSILNASGVAVIPTIVIEDLQSEYTPVTANVSKTINDTTYYGFNVAKTDAAFEVYNSSGQQIVTQKVLDGNNLFIAVGTASGQSVQIRKLTGGSVTNGAGGSGGVNLDAVYPVGSVFQTTVDLGYPRVGTWGYIGNSNGEEITINVSKRITLAVNTDEPIGAGYRAEYYDTINANLSLSDLTFSPDDDSELSTPGVYYNPSNGNMSVECGYYGSESTVVGTLSYKITTKKYTYTRIS